MNWGDMFVCVLCTFVSQPEPTSHRIRVPVFAMIPVHLADEWKREQHTSDANHEMDVGVHGWVSTPRYSWSCTKVHCHERVLYFNSTLFSLAPHTPDQALHTQWLPTMPVSRWSVRSRSRYVVSCCCALSQRNHTSQHRVTSSAPPAVW